MTDCFEPRIFVRHHRQLRAVQLESQAWFCLQDAARLMGKSLDERSLQKLDPDQHRIAWLKNDGQWSKQILISESALFSLLVYHYVPENRAFRYWLTHEVLPALRESEGGHLPKLNAMKWSKRSVGTLEWGGEYWVRLSEVPEVIFASKNRIGFEVSGLLGGLLKRMGRGTRAG